MQKIGLLMAGSLPSLGRTPILGWGGMNVLRLMLAKLSTDRICVCWRLMEQYRYQNMGQLGSLSRPHNGWTRILRLGSIWGKEWKDFGPRSGDGKDQDSVFKCLKLWSHGRGSDSTLAMSSLMSICSHFDILLGEGKHTGCFLDC